MFTQGHLLITQGLRNVHRESFSVTMVVVLIPVESVMVTMNVGTDLMK